ncbi:MAG: hypothetical protein JW883_17265 [Deltaproteobacteria bacterium]|nr:hypothetical protein [Deltaproteobacteria bacterium]
MKLNILLLLGSFCALSWGGPACTQPLETITEQIKPQVVQLRELPFLQEIETIFQSPEDLQRVLQREIERTYPGEALCILETRLLKFGFILSPINLERLLTQLYSQQIAGYYDPIEKKMALVQESASGPPPSLFPLEMMTQLLIQSMGLSLDNILLAHELTHVLQDQHFDLLSLPFEDLQQEDMASAVRALIEGDATLVMIDYILDQQQAGLDATQVPDIAASMQRWANSPLMRGFGLFQTVPRYIMDNLLFSYLQGFEFVLRLKQQGHWKTINQAYTDLPVSTEQILHPEKYFEERDWPTVIALPDFAEKYPDWRLLEQNTLGEFNIHLLLDGFLPKEQARLAAAGWDGDRFGLYKHNETGNLFLAWYTIWDTAQDAREFFETYAAMLEKRFPGNAEPCMIEDSASVLTWVTETGTVRLEVHDNDVLLLDGFPVQFQEDFVTTFWKSVKTDFQRD